MQMRRDIGQEGAGSCAPARTLKYAVVTFGCRVNQADSLAHRRRVRWRGAPLRSPPDEADVVVVNTCSVTATADQGARQTIRRVARTNPSVRVIVDRVLRDARARRSLRTFPNVAHVVPNTDKDALLESIGDEPGCRPRSASTAVTGPVAAASRRASPVERRSRCACRPDATSAAATASFRRRAAAAGRSPLTTVVARRPSRRRRRLQGDRDHRRAPRFVRARPSASASSLAVLLRRLAEWPADVLFRVSSLEPMDCTPDDRRAGGRLAADRAALPSAAAARCRCHAPRDAPSVHRGLLLSARRSHRAADAARVDRLRRHRRLSWRDRRRSSTRASRCCAILPLSHLHVFPVFRSSGNRGERAVGQRSTALSIRERGQTRP